MFDIDYNTTPREPEDLNLNTYYMRTMTTYQAWTNQETEIIEVLARDKVDAEYELDKHFSDESSKTQLFSFEFVEFGCTS